MGFLFSGAFEVYFIKAEGNKKLKTIENGLGFYACPGLPIIARKINIKLNLVPSL